MSGISVSRCNTTCYSAAAVTRRIALGTQIHHLLLHKCGQTFCYELYQCAFCSEDCEVCQFESGDQQVILNCFVDSRAGRDPNSPISDAEQRAYLDMAEEVFEGYYNVLVP